MIMKKLYFIQYFKKSLPQIAGVTNGERMAFLESKETTMKLNLDVMFIVGGEIVQVNKY
jgi:hypothetical protein